MDNSSSISSTNSNVRFKLIVSYTGTHYHGWQIQIRDNIQIPTIQGYLEDAIAHVVGVKCHVHGAGRTDAGVHADAQVAHVDVPKNKAHVNWQLALNTILPPDIRIYSFERVDSNFHAQFDAKIKRYEYHLWTYEIFTPPKLYPFVWNCGGVNVDQMIEGGKYLVGTHDFSSVRNAGSNILTSVRTLRSVKLETNISGYVDGENELVWSFEADGFLKQMVRNCMGLLVAVGKGKIMPSDIADILIAKKREHQGMTAPAKGLTLKWIQY